MSTDDYGDKRQPKFLDGGAPDLAVDSNLIADYAAKVGNKIVGTTAERNAYTSSGWEGLEWYDTTNKATYRHVSGAWALPKGWRFPRAGSESDLYAAGSFATLASGSISNAPPGDYLITATAVVAGSESSVGYMRVTAGGVNLSADARLDANQSPQPYPYSDVLTNFAGGTLDVSLAVQTALGTGTVYKNGTGIRVAYLGRS